MTNDTANENFITDQGSTRLTNRRARRGPRPAAAETVLRAVRTASATRLPGPDGSTVPRPAGRPAAMPGRGPAVDGGMVPAGGAGAPVVDVRPVEDGLIASTVAVLVPGRMASVSDSSTDALVAVSCGTLAQPTADRSTPAWPSAVS